MKITRQNLQEEYNVTADWLKDFARQLQKQSYNIENLTTIRQMTDSPRKFGSIEEKMADIKRRIGFDVIKKIHEENGLEDKTASTDCGCGGHDEKSCACDIKVASDKKSHKEEDLKNMKNILNYIQDLCDHEHENLTPVIVISRCREEPGLHFDELPINMEKLNKFIKDKLDKYSHSEDDVKYTPRDDANDVSYNSEAEYWSHAFPANS